MTINVIELFGDIRNRKPMNPIVLEQMCLLWTVWSITFDNRVNSCTKIVSKLKYVDYLILTLFYLFKFMEICKYYF